MLICGDAAHLPLADGSVHCIVTSPPFWGLRSYGVPPQVWGGDPCCPHTLAVGNAEGETYAGRKRWQHEGVSRQETPGEWVKVPTVKRGHPGELTTLVGTQTADLSKSAIDQGATCRLCGAWRGNLGLEPLHDCTAWARGEPPCATCYVCHLRTVARELWRVLRDDGTLWLNLGDAYAHPTSGGGGAVDVRKDGRHTTPGDKVRGRMAGANTLIPGLKPKDLVGIPWRVALALQADGWYLRSDIIWAKPNPMPESVRDRPTTAHEYVFLLAKQQRYYYDADAIREQGQEWEGRAGTFARNGAVAEHIIPGQSAAEHRSTREDRVPAGRNKRTVWTIPTQPFSGAHFATFPEALVTPMVLAGSRRGDIVLDPFCGSGTVGEVCRKLGREFIGVDLSAVYLRELALPRAEQQVTAESLAQLPLFGGE